MLDVNELKDKKLTNIVGGSGDSTYVFRKDDCYIFNNNLFVVQINTIEDLEIMCDFYGKIDEQCFYVETNTCSAKFLSNDCTYLGQKS